MIYLSFMRRRLFLLRRVQHLQNFLHQCQEYQHSLCGTRTTKFRPFYLYSHWARLCMCIPVRIIGLLIILYRIRHFSIYIIAFIYNRSVIISKRTSQSFGTLLVLIQHHVEVRVISAILVSKTSETRDFNLRHINKRNSF